MAKKTAKNTGLTLEGVELLRQVFPILRTLAKAGTERDRARNRQLLYSQYASLILVSLFNPVLGTARALVAHSGVKRVRKLTGGSKVSLGSFSEAARVFDPQLLNGILDQLREELRRRQLPRLLSTARLVKVPDKLIVLHL